MSAASGSSSTPVEPRDDDRSGPDSLASSDRLVPGQGLVEYGLIAAIAILVAVLALTVFDDQVAFVLSVIGSEIDRAT